MVQRFDLCRGGGGKPLPLQSYRLPISSCQARIITTWWWGYDQTHNEILAIQLDLQWRMNIDPPRDDRTTNDINIKYIYCTHAFPLYIPAAFLYHVRSHLLADADQDAFRKAVPWLPLLRPGAGTCRDRSECEKLSTIPLWSFTTGGSTSWVAAGIESWHIREPNYLPMNQSSTCVFWNCSYVEVVSQITIMSDIEMTG